MTEVTTQALATHPFLRGMPPGHLAALAETATDAVFPAGHRILAEGGYAARFWLIRSGSVALDMLVPGEGPVVIDTVGMGGLVGWSWLFPPYQWAFGAVCASPVEAFELDAAAVRSRCAADPALGFDLTTRLARVLAGRLQVTRTRLITRPRDAPRGQ
ncbi:MAG TPA: cyclic nucleotide-binding domain-containing protein [Trebonia sp.]|nr:cyclic nucleotide-binding domain-containing protein [Trebonia sp.]